MNLRVVAVSLLAIGVGFWCVGFGASLLGNLTAGNVWYSVSAAASIASATAGVVALFSSKTRSP